jgi:lipid II:glycine glycyltransferase (peptidoglycan interpeptide bridge formation enzyme)
VVNRHTALPQHQLEIAVADRDHQMPPHRPQDHLGTELPALESLTLPYRCCLLPSSHATVCSRPDRQPKLQQNPQPYADARTAELRPDQLIPKQIGYWAHTPDPCNIAGAAAEDADRHPRPHQRDRVHGTYGVFLSMLYTEWEMMMRDEAADEQHIKELGKWKIWDEFLKSNVDIGFRQSSWYTTFKFAYDGSEHFGTVLRDRETIVGGAVVFKRSFTSEKCYYYMPDGPVLLKDDSDAEQEQVFHTIMERIEKKRQNEQQLVSHLCINPPWERVPSFVRGFQEASHYYGLPRDTQCIDLNPSESTILAQMKPKGRYNIGVAQRYGVSVVEDVSPQGVEDFLNICAETFARKDLDKPDADYFHELISTLSASECGSVFFADYQGTRLATALVVYFGRTATYYYGGSRAIHRNVMAPYLLQFEIMRKAKALGCQYYDLFGITPQNEPSNGWTDISAFKRKFGGQEIRLVPTLEYIYDPIAYQEWRDIERDRQRERRRRRVEAIKSSVEQFD